MTSSNYQSSDNPKPWRYYDRAEWIEEFIRRWKENHHGEMPSNNTIARDTEIPRPTVVRIVSELSEKNCP